MSRGTLSRVISTVILVACGAVAAERHVSGQSSGMSISVYTDVYQSEDLNMVVYATVMDNSWGCGHSGYMTTAYITSPEGRFASHQSSGLYGNVSIPIDAEYGDYSVNTSGTYQCSCI